MRWGSVRGHDGGGYVKVSVICPTFNHASYLSDALDGILMQETEFPIQAIIYDDASTDGTREILRIYAAAYPEIIEPIYQSENQYRQGRRHKQFTYPRVRGEFVALCEGDDYWTDPRKLQLQVDALERRPGIGLCIHPAERYSMRTGKSRRCFWYGPHEKVLSVENILARRTQFAATASVMMRVDHVRQVPDWWFYGAMPTGDFFVESIVGRGGALYLPENMAVYRRGVPGSYTKRFERSRGIELEEAMTSMLHYVDELSSIPGIPARALRVRKSYVQINYALQFLSVGDRKRFLTASDHLDTATDKKMVYVVALLRRSRCFFNIGSYLFKILRHLRS